MQHNENKTHCSLFFVKLTSFFILTLQIIQASKNNQHKVGSLKIDLELVKRSHQEVSQARKLTLIRLQRLAIKHNISLEKARKVSFHIPKKQG